MTAAALHQDFRRHRTRRWIVIGLGFVALTAAILASLALGVETLSLSKTIRGLASSFLPAGWTADLSPTQILILQELRLPRTLMTVISGAGLSIAGVAMQGITRNALVSPDTIGISPAAAFGVSVAILLGLGTMTGSGAWWSVGAAFLAALACAGLVLALSAMRGMSGIVLVLAGIGLTYFFTALRDSARFIATEEQLSAIIHWTFGTVDGATWNQVGISGVILIMVAPILYAHAWALNAFAAGGEDVAASLGFAVARTRFIVTICAVLITAGITSFVGVIAFVGLVSPHIARLLIGSDHRVLLPFAAIVGALLLLAADLIGRLAFAPIVIPVGIVFAYIGVPIFLHLLIQRKSELAL